MNELPNNKSMARAIGRYIEEDGSLGRYVSPKLIAEYGDKPTQTYLCRLFVATADGQSFYPKSILQNSAFEWSDELVQDIQFQGHNSQLIKSDIENTDLFICMIVPQKSIVEILAPSERLLLLAIIVLLLCFPLFWSILYRRLLIPLRKLSAFLLQSQKRKLCGDQHPSKTGGN